MWGASLQSDHINAVTTLVLTAPSGLFALFSLIALALAFVGRVTLIEIVKRWVQPIVDAATVRKEIEAAKQAIADAKNDRLALLAERAMIESLIAERDRLQAENIALRQEKASSV